MDSAAAGSALARVAIQEGNLETGMKVEMEVKVKM